MKENGAKENIGNARHSLAHLLAMAVLKKFPEAKLGIGPVIDAGFYYDFLLPRPLKNEELPELEQEMRRLIKSGVVFKKGEISAGDGKRIFQNQPFKLELIEGIAGVGEPLSVYESGKFVDLCKGPHVKTAAEISADAFKLDKIAGAYWRGSEKNPMLTRIYGVAFSSKKELDDYLKLQKEIEKRDHRRLGEKLDLFSFHDIAPGAPFWHQNGMTVVNELKKFIRELQQKAGYQETSTPVLVKENLYETSGHLSHYRENLFELTIENEKFDLKAMNCPESTFIFSAKLRSYKDLPVRLSEFGLLHRRERSGTLTGLFRVYAFTQDDSHIYCREDQIQKEISGVLSLIKKIHGTFGLKTKFFLSTKPEKAMGDPELWKRAEAALGDALKKNRLDYRLNEGDGAFYGPKIDVNVSDSLGREWTLATIQLDFQMPQRFNLSYIDEKGEKKKPVMIHRSSIGSFERFIGLLLEHFSGNLPLWLAPVQVQVLPIGKKHLKYAKKVFGVLSENGVRAELRDENESVGKKIREGEIRKIPYLLVVGDKEMKSKSVAVRKREKGDTGSVKLEKFAKQIAAEIEKKK